MNKTALACIAICAGSLMGCFPPSDLTGDLRPPATGRLTVTIDGLPGEAPGLVSVSGPQGFSRTLTVTETLAALPPGAYSISAAEVPVGEDRYGAATATQHVAVSPGIVPDSARVRYLPVTGRLHIAVDSVPTGALAQVVVTGPAAYTRTLADSATLAGLAPGLYSIAASRVETNGDFFDPEPSTQAVQVGALGPVPVAAAVKFTRSSGRIAVSVGGLPGGAPASVQVSGPNGFTHLVTASTTLTGLPPGSYTMSAASITLAGNSYQPSPATGSVLVTTSNKPEQVSVWYALATGSLQVFIAGLPPESGGAVTVAGPQGYAANITASTLLTGLAPGTYTLSATSVQVGQVLYQPAPATQSISITASLNAEARSVTYAPSGGGASINLRIDGLYLTQATQAYDGSVPLVAGRDAYLRAFVIANQANTAQPQVRVRFYHGTNLIQTQTIPAPAVGVPTGVNEGALTSSWNLLVPALLVQPGLRISADVDPSSGIAEANENDNQFPAAGASAAVDVRSLPVFSIRFVPVLQQVNGLQGSVTEASKEAFLRSAKAMLPLGGYSADVRAVYTTTAAVLQSDNGNGAWGTILNEVLALRNADASSRYYFGVVKTGYGSGVVGMGYVGGNARSALGWDVMSNAPSTVAHELGHNMGRSHAPCGGPGGPDPSYPYPGGIIGVSGLDVSTLTIKSTSVADLMGYCHTTWISDYSWKGMLAYREGGPNNAPQPMGPASGLLVWGRITSSGVVLEPAFRVAAHDDLLPVAGPNVLELVAEDGRMLRSVRFDATEVADLPGGEERHFAFVVPMESATERDLAGLRVRTGSRSASRVASSAASSDPEPALSRVNGEQVEIRWNAARYPMVMVKDARTGEVLSFARGGSARLWARSSDFQLTFSDGVKSVTRQGRILQ